MTLSYSDILITSHLVFSRSYISQTEMLGEGMVKVCPKESCRGLCMCSDMCISVNADGFRSPSPSNAMHQSPGFQWLGTEACHKDALGKVNWNWNISSHWMGRRSVSSQQQSLLCVRNTSISASTSTSTSTDTSSLDVRLEACIAYTRKKAHALTRFQFAESSNKFCNDASVFHASHEKHVNFLHHVT